MAVKSRQKLLVHEAEPYWCPAFHRELDGRTIEIQPVTSLDRLSPRIHPEDHAILWTVVPSVGAEISPGEQVRQILALQKRHPHLAIVVLVPPALRSIKWVLYELETLAVLDPQIPLIPGVRLCRQYWRSVIS